MVDRKKVAIGAGLAGLVLFLFSRRASANDLIPANPVDPNDEPCGPGEVKLPDGRCVSLGNIPADIDPNDTLTPAELVDLVKNTPTPDAFYQAKLGDTFLGMVRQALSLPNGSPLSVPAVQCIYRVGYNLTLYSKRVAPGAQGAQNFPVNIGGQRYNLDSALRPQNARVAPFFLAGELPPRQFTATGAARANTDGIERTFGAVWIPDFAVQQGVLMCPGGPVPDPWDPDLNPPPEALAAMGTSLAELRAMWMQDGV